MTTVLNSRIEEYVADFRAREAVLPAGEPVWLRALRRQAMERFAALGWPSVKHADWKFNNLKSLPDEFFRSPGVQEITREVELPLSGRFEAHLLVFVDGHYAPGLSDPGVLPAGASLETLSAAWRRDPQRVRPKLSSLAGFESRAFSALNTAFMADGLWLHLAPGTRLERPIHMLCLAGAGESGLMTSPRALVVAEAGSAATIIESHASLGTGAQFVNTATEIEVGAGAEIRHIKLQRQHETAYHIGLTAVRQERESRYRSWELNLGGAMARKECHVRLAGEGADCELNSLYLGRGEQRLDNRTRVVHGAPGCRTRELYKGILDGRSHGIFDGMILVEQDAQQTDARQTNRNLLLSPDAVVNSLPQLEIYADDVKCTHGSTTGALDDAQLFYLRARGFTMDAARALLTHAFASEIIESIGLDEVMRELKAELLGRLPQGELIGRSL